VAQFNQAIACDPRYVEAYLALGQAYLRKDSLPPAVAVLQRGLTLGIEQEQFYANLGYCYLMKAIKDSALLYYRRAIACDSTKADYYFNVAYLLNGPGQNDESIECLRTAMRLSPDKAQVSYLLGCRLLDRPVRSRAEIAEGMALLQRYLADGDGDPMKTAKAREKLEQEMARQ
jgi:tetratricopeptide (TPR) repeat protein